MTSCSQLEELEALVMGELEQTHARVLRAHAATCEPCATELAMLTAERELFARRAQAFDAPLPAFVSPPRAARAVEEPPMAQLPRILPALGRLAMRGHFSAACAAALFVVAALSRLGTSSMSASMSLSMSDDAVATADDADGAGSGMLASYGGGETLVCTLGGLGSNAMSRDDGLMTSSSSGGSRAEVLACGAGTASRATGAASCEPSVTCSALRQ